ncbi:hypothetical protein M9H77_14254 [Catharanthus roseus]|uniref:Uncharacterized protein n=1 Tax=Catharanthus roseus TaxID=4058 RepID=A0ACC0BMP9_CATRO|nr:hypothetical protein M9H77_14254 [Catharanthus roseus]
MYREVSVTKNLNRAPSKPVWQDMKESMRSLQLNLIIWKRIFGNMDRRLDQREHEYAKGGYYRNLGYQNMMKAILTTKLDKVSSQSYTFLEYPLMLGDATCDNSCNSSLYNSRMNDYYSYVANVDSFVLGVENKVEHILGVLDNKGNNLEKELFNLQEETTMSFYLNPSPLYYEFPFKELNFLLESLSFHNLCVLLLHLAFSGNLFYHLPSTEFLEKAVFEEVSNKLHALVFPSSLILEYFGHFHSITSFNALTSNVARLLWLYEGLDSRTNPFKEEV